MARPSFKLEWDAHEYEHKERSGDWFWAVGIIAVALALVSIIFGNIILAILILIGTFTLTLFAKRSPDNLHVVVDEKGVTRNRVHYPYSTLHSFSIDTDHPHKKIILRSKKLLMPLITVPLSDEVDAEELHDYLSQSLPEEFHTLPFIEKILDHLGF